MITCLLRSVSLTAIRSFTVCHNGSVSKFHSLSQQLKMDPSVSEDEDEQLRLAIAMSLQEQAGGASKNGKEKTFVDLLDDSDSEDNPKATAQATNTKSSSSNENPKGPLAFLGIDRKAMEAERLARQRKRKASISPPPLSRPTKTSKSTATPPPASMPSGSRITSMASRNTTTSSQSTDGIQYPNGVVRKTWAFGFPRDNDIKIEEVLQKSTLQLGVLSSFQWDMDWLMPKLDISRSKIIFVMQAKDQATKDQYTRETAHIPNLRLCFPSMAGNVNCMHSKLMLLSHPTHLRIVIPTANLTDYDWGSAGGIIENTVFLIDLPRLAPLPDASDAPEQGQGEDALTFFGKELLHFCRHSDIPAEICASLLRFDFSATAPYAFVHTIGGEHVGEKAWKRTGYPGLGRAVRKLGLATESDVEVDFVTSSVGSLNLDFLSALYLAARGDDGVREFAWRSRPKSRGKAAASKTTENLEGKEIHEKVRRCFRVFFPSQDTVLRSKGGRGAAGPICFQKQWWNGPKFPRGVMRDCRSTRKGMLMHNKIMYVRHAVEVGESDIQDSSAGNTFTKDTSTKDQTTEDRSNPTTQAKAHAYIGSANCSESAWGRLVLDRSTKAPKLGCRNWESGVLIPVGAGSGERPGEELEARSAESMRLGKNMHFGPESEAGRADLSVFAGTVPVPVEWPGDPMGGRREPWFFLE